MRSLDSKRELFFKQNKYGRYIQRIGTALSVLFNVILGGNSNQTLSARNYQLQKEGKINIVPLLNFIFMNPEHCMHSWIYWRVRKDVRYEMDKK